MLYNTGLRQQHKSIDARPGLNVVNIGVANLSLTTRTDLANKLILLMEEYSDILPLIYSEESTEGHIELYFNSLIDKLLIGQLESNKADYTNLAKYKQENLMDKKALSNLSQSSYFVQHI